MCGEGLSFGKESPSPRPTQRNHCGLAHVFSVERGYVEDLSFAQEKFPTFIILDKRSVRAVCKPSSVLDDHLSRPKVAIRLKRLSRERDGPPLMLSYQSCTRWGLHSGRVARPLVSSYLTFPPLRPSRRKVRGISLLHFPWSRLHWHFTSTLPCGARTFLACFHTRGRPAASQTKRTIPYPAVKCQTRLCCVVEKDVKAC